MVKAGEDGFAMTDALVALLLFSLTAGVLYLIANMTLSVSAQTKWKATAHEIGLSVLKNDAVVSSFKQDVDGKTYDVLITETRTNFSGDKWVKRERQIVVRWVGRNGGQRDVSFKDLALESAQ